MKLKLNEFTFLGKETFEEIEYLKLRYSINGIYGNLNTIKETKNKKLLNYYGVSNDLIIAPNKTSIEIGTKSRFNCNNCNEKTKARAIVMAMLFELGVGVGGTLFEDINNIVYIVNNQHNESIINKFVNNKIDMFDIHELNQYLTKNQYLTILEIIFNGHKIIMIPDNIKSKQKYSELIEQNQDIIDLYLSWVFEDMFKCFVDTDIEYSLNLDIFSIKLEIKEFFINNINKYIDLENSQYINMKKLLKDFSNTNEYDQQIDELIDRSQKMMRYQISKVIPLLKIK